MNFTKQVARYLIGNATFSFALLTLVYVGLIFLLPANPRTMRAYDLTSFEYHSLILAIALPSILVWFAAFVGYSKLVQYAQSIRRTSEGHHFRQLAKGAIWLAWSLPITAIVGFLLSSTAGHNPNFLPTAIIISNYLNVILPLLAFTLIGSASRGLVSDAKLRFSLSSVRWIMFGFVVAGVAYCYFVFRRLDLSSLTATTNIYYLPIWLLVLTIIVPYLYIWFVGTLAAYEIQLFSKKAPGVLYRRALRMLALGIIVIIAGSIALQYINGIQPRAGYLILNYKLLLILLFRLVEGAGFVLLAVGASRLKKIEEV